MHDTVELESRGLPTALIITTEFQLEAKVQRDALGMGALDPVVIEHPLSSLTDAEIASLATRIQDLPAGADPTTIGILLVVALVVWRLWVDAQEKEAAASKRTTTAPAKPAPKPEAK